jgi:tetratricopeptide (TPR) repeat protein/mono/diheme cytochrome c family protein
LLSVSVEEIGMNAIARLGLAALLATVPGSRAGAAGEAEAAQVARKAKQILEVNCHRCHGQDGTNEGGFNFVLDRRQLVNRNKIVPGNPKKSKLFRRVTDADTPMPPEEEKPRPSTEDIALLKKWIDAGAPDFDEHAPKRARIAAVDILRHMAADLARIPKRDRRFTRYLTLTHLHNAGLGADEIQSFRHGLAKLVNSLSWGKRVALPYAIDPAGTVLRIDLRDYHWTVATWDAILAANPYGVHLDSRDARFCASATGTALPYVRGDWLVAAASRPPLYHEVLQLPGTDTELEKILGVDVGRNIRQERTARAGFNGSGVSRNNRLIERHEAGDVVYWKSYDFAGNTGRKNLFAHPLGPEQGPSSFAHDGGEIIFTLPNHLQAYLLVDAKGNRIDKGPVSIVSDPRRPDRAVENGLSCMSCHARGLIEKADQVRAHVRRSSEAFPSKEMRAILALYRSPESLNALLKRDARRFQKAVEKTGAPWSATEPIAALALRFEAELDLALAAAEAESRPADFLQALDRSPYLAKHLGPLRVDGGTIQRQVFVDAFPELVSELRLGKYLEPRLSAYAALVRRGDVLARKGETADAIRAYTEAITLDHQTALAYHKRGSAHHDAGAIALAIADYTQALRVAPQDAVAHNNRGLAYLAKREHERALEDFNEALRLDPRYAIALHNRGLAYQRAGEAEKAIADFGAAIRLDPKYVLAYHNRAAAHYERGTLNRAIADYTAVLRLNPKSVTAFNNRGFAYYDKEDFDRAIADFSAAIRLDSRHAVARYNRGLAHFDKEDFDKAIADFSAAIRLDPKFARAYLGRSNAYRNKGDSSRAEADRAEAARLEPNLDRD